MANRLYSSGHAMGPNTNKLREKQGLKNRGIARFIKDLKREEAIERQQRNIDRGGYVCFNSYYTCNGGTTITIGELNASYDYKAQYSTEHAHTPKPLESQIRNKSNELRMVANF